MSHCLQQGRWMGAYVWLWSSGMSYVLCMMKLVNFLPFGSVRVCVWVSVCTLQAEPLDLRT